MKGRILTYALLSVLTIGCGRVGDNREQDKTADGASLSPDNSAGQSTSVPPAYVSHTVVSNNKIEVTLSKECTDASVTNTANYIISGGLGVQSAVKDTTDKTKIVITTTTQLAQSYTLTLLNLTSTTGTPITGVIQILFTGLALPAATYTWRNPVDQSALPITIGSWTLCNPNLSTAACTVQPYYNKNGVDIVVGGSNVAAYKFKLDAGSWGSEIPVGTPLTISGLSEGFHTLYVVVKHTLGYWQEVTSPDVKTFSWIQDTIAPSDAVFDPVTLPTTPGGITASQSVNIRIIGSEVARYRYCLTSGVYTDCNTNNFASGPTSVNTNISIPDSVYTNILTPGAVTLKVVGYDASGNAQTVPGAGGTFSYNIDTNNVEAVFDVADLPGSINNGVTSASVDILGTYGAVTYIGQIIDGTNCATVPWVALSASPIPISTPLARTGMTDATPQKTICAIGKNLAGAWQGGWSGAGTPPNITKYTWVIDTSAPVASIFWKNPIAAPTSTTLVAGYQFQVSSTGGGSHYRYAVVTGAGTACSTGTYSGNITLETDIAVDPPVIAVTGTTVYKVCVVAGDLAGNWQSTASATATAEWTVDLDPPALNPGFAAASAIPRSFNTAALTFSINNGAATGDSFYYRVQVATDTGFTNIIGDSTVKSCKAISLPDCPAALGTKDFTIAVDSFQSPSYYARIQTGDSLGNLRSDFSAISAEHFVVGKITGTVKNQAGTILSGIDVKLLTIAGSDVTSLYGGPITTNGSGVFTIDNVRTAKLGYQVRVAVGDATYYPAAKRNITVQEKGPAGTIQTNVGTISIAAISGSSAQTINAKIVDADDGWLLGYADVSLIDYLGNVVSTQRSIDTTCATVAPNGAPPTNLPKHTVVGAAPTCGDVSFTMVPAGTYTIRVNGASWGTANQQYNQLNVENVVVFASTVNRGRVPMVRLLTGQDLKIVLEWGNAEPRDLDMHVVGTSPVIVTNANADNCGGTNNTDFHVNWRRGGTSWQQQFSAKTKTHIQANAMYNAGGICGAGACQFFPLDPSTTTALVQDVTTGYGPEAINFITGYTDGTVWISVVNWRQYRPGGGATQANQQWDQSPSIILKVYDADGLAFEVSVATPTVNPTALAPATLSAGCQSTADWQQCDLWQAAKITIAGNGSAGRKYTPVNTFVKWNNAGEAPAGSNSYDFNKCNLNTF